MASLDVGRVCMKTAGRESGAYCVVLKNVNRSFVLVTGPRLLTGVKRRNANIAHLAPTDYKIDVNENSTDEQIVDAMKKSGVVTKFGLKMPSAAQLKSRQEKQEKKAAASQEKMNEPKKGTKKKEAKKKQS